MKMHPCTRLAALAPLLLLACEARAGATPNEPPAITAPATATLDEEGTTPVVISVADSDADEDTMRATVTAPATTLTVTVTPIPAATVTGNGTAALEVTGELQAINAVLATLVVRGVTDFNTHAGTLPGTPVPLVVFVDDRNGTVAETDTETVSVTVNPVNDPPVVPTRFPVALDEDAARTARLELEPGISDARDTAAPAAPGGAAIVPLGSLAATTTPAHGSVTFTATDGSLRYVPQADYVGTDSFALRLCDRGTPAATPACVDATVDLTVGPVNDAPTFTATDPPASQVGDGARTVNAWAAFAPGGGADEATQTAVAYTVSAVGNPALFSAAPSVAPNGTLSYTPNGIAGTSSFTVTVRDSGGTANGGVDTSAPRVFTITVGGGVPGPALPVPALHPGALAALALAFLALAHARRRAAAA